MDESVALMEEMTVAYLMRCVTDMRDLCDDRLTRAGGARETTSQTYERLAGPYVDYDDDDTSHYGKLTVPQLQYLLRYDRRRWDSVTAAAEDHLRQY
jgi:hypothetical protein